MKKMLFIMNPYAGQRKAAKSLAQILEIFNRAGYEVNTYMTAGPGDATTMAKTHAANVDLVACCGGDGTFNETISGVIASGAKVPIGYIPAGSTNDFANSLHLPLDPVQAAKVITEGSSRPVDVGVFGDRYFSYVASFGAFTRASYATPQSLKNVLGHAAYVLSGIAEITQLKAENVCFRLSNGQTVEGPFLFGAISNSTCVAGILTLPPDHVDMSDGKLEIMLIRAPKDLVELGEVINAIQTQTYQCSALTFLSTEGVEVTASSDMAWTLDGEHQEGVSQVSVRCLHHGIEVICPNSQEDKL